MINKLEQKKNIYMPESIKFLSQCPYFLNNGCQSINWNLKGPCGMCFKKGVFDTNNAQIIASVYNTFPSHKER